MAEDSKNRKQDLSEHLKVQILTTQFAPGADIDEMALSKEFGLSRTPLREVFRELAGRGYLTLQPNRGARVADLSFQTLRGFFQAAPMVYGAVLQMAAMNASAAQIEALCAAQEEFRASLKGDSGAARTLANNRFHEITGDMAGNIYLLPSFQRLLIDHARLGMTFFHPQNDKLIKQRELACQQHDQIIDAIKARDAEAARCLADDHWNLSRDQFEMFVMPDPIKVTPAADLELLS